MLPPYDFNILLRLFIELCRYFFIQLVKSVAKNFAGCNCRCRAVRKSEKRRNRNLLSNISPDANIGKSRANQISETPSSGGWSFDKPKLSKSGERTPLSGTTSKL